MSSNYIKLHLIEKIQNSLLDIERIFQLVKNMYPQYAFELVSGGLADIAKKENSNFDIVNHEWEYLLSNPESLSDVDICLYSLNPEKVNFDAISVTKKSRHHIFHLAPIDGREVNIFVTNDRQKLNRAIIHRKNELKLFEEFPDLAFEAALLKSQCNNTEAAWSLTLKLTGDPFEEMARSDLLEIAKKVENIHK